MQNFSFQFHYSCTEDTNSFGRIYCFAIARIICCLRKLTYVEFMYFNMRKYVCSNNAQNFSID